MSSSISVNGELSTSPSPSSVNNNNNNNNNTNLSSMSEKKGNTSSLLISSLEESSLQQSTDALAAFKNDEFYAQFLPTEFDAKKFISSIISSGSAGASLEKITNGIGRLDKEIYSQVVGHHEDLMKQVSNIKDLEAVLKIISKGVEGLQLSINKIKVDISEPYLLIRTRTIQLERIQYASELLRRILRFWVTSTKLRRYMSSSSRELPKAAQCLYEIETIRKEIDLSGIEMIDNETRWIVKTSEDLLSTASRMLIQSMDSLNQTEMATSLQVFYYLKLLEERINSTISTVTEKATNSITSVLSINSITEELKATGGLPTGSSSTTVNNLSSASSAPTSKTAAVRQALWVRMEKLVDTLHTCCVQVYHLQRVLGKMRDPSTHVCLLDELTKAGEPSLTRSFWKTLTNILSDKLAEAAKNSTIIENTFVSEYPKLLRLFKDFHRRLQTHYEIKQQPAPQTSLTNSSGLSTNTAFNEEQTLLLKTLSRFETAYLGRCVSKLSEPINLMFSTSGGRVATTPSSDDVASFARIITTEFESALVDANLTLAIGKTVGKTLKHFVVRTENLTITEPEAHQVTEAACNSSQIRNANIFNALHQLHASMLSLLQTLPNNVKEGAIGDAVKSLERQCIDILTPLFHKLRSVLEKTVLSMHLENYAVSKAPETQPESKYMKLLQHQINNFSNVIMAPYPTSSSSSLIHQQHRSLSIWLVNLFLRSASLVRPISDPGKLKLAGELAQLELALASLYPVKELGQPYKMLRAFRPLLFQETDKIGASAEAKILLPSHVLHHLLSRAPADLQSPQTLKNWTLGQYCSWMDEHSEDEIWGLIKSCLEAYAQKVNARGEREYAVVYPLILSLGPQLLDNYNQRTNTNNHLTNSSTTNS